MAQYYDIKAIQNADYELIITWKKEDGSLVNLTGYTAKFQVKDAIESGSYLLQLTNGSGITLGGAAGTVLLNITAAQTNAIAYTTETTPKVYALQVTSGAGVITELVWGNFFNRRKIII